MAFNKENKVSYEELAPSLQEMLNNKATLEDFNDLLNKFNQLYVLSNGVRISIVTALSKITTPTNDKEIAIVTSDTVNTIYTYHANKWVKVHAVYA